MSCPDLAFQTRHPCALFSSVPLFTNPAKGANVQNTQNQNLQFFKMQSCSWGGAAYHFETAPVFVHCGGSPVFNPGGGSTFPEACVRPKCCVSWLCIHQWTPRSSKLAALLCGAPLCFMLTLAADLQIHDGVVNKLLGGSLVRGSHKILGRPRAHIGRKGLPKEWAAHALTLTQAAAHNMYIYM
jgi:hypothetical protein